MSWNYDNIVPPAATPPAKQEAAAPAPVEKQTNTQPLSNEEMQKVTRQIDAYSANPSIQGEISKLASAHQGNPEHLATLVRELSDAIDAVKANPHLSHNVSPEIKQAVEQIRQVELEKPDPLNLLRDGASSLANAFSLQAPAKSQEQNPLAGPFEVLDMGPTTAALAFNMPPVQNVPDVRQALGIARGGRSA